MLTPLDLAYSLTAGLAWDLSEVSLRLELFAVLPSVSLSSLVTGAGWSLVEVPIVLTSAFEGVSDFCDPELGFEVDAEAEPSSTSISSNIAPT